MKCALHNCFGLCYSVEKVGSVLLRPSQGQFWQLSVLKLLIYYWENSCKHFKSSKQIRRELKIQIFPRQNYEPLDIKCNFLRPSSSESSLSLIQQKLEDPPDLTCCSCLLSKSQTYKLHINTYWTVRWIKKGLDETHHQKVCYRNLLTNYLSLCLWTSIA